MGVQISRIRITQNKHRRIRERQRGRFGQEMTRMTTIRRFSIRKACWGSIWAGKWPRDSIRSRRKDRRFKLRNRLLDRSNINHNSPFSISHNFHRHRNFSKSTKRPKETTLKSQIICFNNTPTSPSSKSFRLLQAAKPPRSTLASKHQSAIS